MYDRIIFLPNAIAGAGPHGQFYCGSCFNLSNEGLITHTQNGVQIVCRWCRAPWANVYITLPMAPASPSPRNGGSG